MRRPRDVHQAILDQQSSALPLAKRIECNFLAAVGSAVELRLDFQWPAKFFGTGRDVEGVQTLHKAAILFGLRGQVHGVGGEIDRRCAGDSDFRNEVITAHVRACNYVNPGAGVDETHLPQGGSIGSGLVIGVEGIDAVVFGRHVDDIVGTLARDVHVGHVERLGIHVSVHRLGEELAKLSLVDVGGRKDGLAGVLSGAVVVVVLGGDCHLRRGGAGQEKCCEQGGGKRARSHSDSLHRMSTELESLKTGRRELSNMKESVGHALPDCQENGAGSRF